MSEPINDGGPVHPHTQNIVYQGAVIGTEQYQGLSLRDYFAGQALAGMLSKQFGTMEENAHDAYFVADAMLKARPAK